MGVRELLGSTCYFFTTLLLAATTTTRRGVSNEIVSAARRPLINTAVALGRGPSINAAASARKHCALALPSRGRCAMRISFIKCIATAGGAATTHRDHLSFVLGRSRVGLDAMIVAKAHAPGLLGSTPVVAQMVATNSLGGISTARVKRLLRMRLPNVRFSCSVSRRMGLGVRKFNNGTILFLMSNRHLTKRALSGVSCGHLGLSGMRQIRVIGNTTSALCNSDTVKKMVGVVAGTSSSP